MSNVVLYMHKIPFATFYIHKAILSLYKIPFHTLPCINTILHIELVPFQFIVHLDLTDTHSIVLLN